MTTRSASLILVALAACATGSAPAAPMIPATELLPGHTADAGDAGDAGSDGSDAADASDDDDGGPDPACANAAHSLKMPTMSGCLAQCSTLPAKPQRGCMTREACKRRCYATFGPM